ncbi:MAG: ankyrin repeat domain-containing protein [Treponema sp.]|nr:ankyrin repeat domain-containing protein [Treponema sp.]
MKRILKPMLTPLYLIMVLICFIACSKSGSVSISEAEASAFVQACKDGDYGYVEKMLKLNRAFTEAKNARGETGLMHAARKGHKDIVSILIKKGIYYKY